MELVAFILTKLSNKELPRMLVISAEKLYSSNGTFHRCLATSSDKPQCLWFEVTKYSSVFSIIELYK